MRPVRTAFRAPPAQPAFARMVAAAVVGSGTVVGALVWVVLTLGGLGQAVLGSAVVPDPDLLGRMLLGAGGAALGLALPLGALAGVAGGARRLADEGAWLGMRTLGVGGRALAAPVGAWLVGGALAWLALTHHGEPAARAALRDARVAAAARVSPIEGRTVRFGPWAAAVEGETLHFAGNELLGVARRWSVAPAAAGVVVELRDGELRDLAGGARMRFATLTVPVPLADGAGRVHPSERTTPDLRRRLAARDAGQADAYDRWILWKRTLLPACLVPLGLAALPLGLRRGAPVPAVVAGQALTLWGVVRVADQAVSAVGLGPATLATFAAACAWLVAAWWGWRDA